MRKHVFLAEKFCHGESEYNVNGAIWKKAFQYVLENRENLEFEKDKIHMLWTELGGALRGKIKNDELILSVLHISLPGYAADQGLELYRGECRFLYEQGKIGFCWTPKIDVARTFASGLNALEAGGGVLLKALAPASAIMAAPNVLSTNQMKEFEYTCNPNILLNISVRETFDQI